VAVGSNPNSRIRVHEVRERTVAITLFDGYLSEVITQCQFCRHATESLDAALRSTGNPTIAPFFYIHALITHAGMISKVLWPNIRKPPAADRKAIESRNRRLATAKELRECLDLEDRSWIVEKP
jgi:hypothetical protein